MGVDVAKKIESTTERPKPVIKTQSMPSKFRRGNIFVRIYNSYIIVVIAFEGLKQSF